MHSCFLDDNSEKKKKEKENGFENLADMARLMILLSLSLFELSDHSHLTDFTLY